MTKDEKVAYWKEYNKAYYESHREQIGLRQRAYNQSHKKERSEYWKAYNESHLPKLTAYREGYYEANRDKKLSYSKAYRDTHRGEARIRQLKNNYGLSLIEFHALFEKQNKLCAVCKTEKFGKLGPVVDHDHAPGGKVRGILCTKCNTAIGLINDDREIALALASYLKKKGDGE